MTKTEISGIARWDAYLHVPDPDALAAEFSLRNVEFFQPLQDNDDGLRGFEVKDADDTCCSSDALNSHKYLTPTLMPMPIPGHETARRIQRSDL